MRSRNAGLSLLEYVVGLAVLAIILVGAGLFFLSQPRQLDPVFQFRAVALAEALAEQVIAVKYDANNNPGLPSRCDVNSPPCLNADTAGTGAELEDFFHVDDFRLWCGDSNAIAGDILAEQLDLTHQQLYTRYSVQTCVEVKNDGSADYKEVTIEVRDQDGSDLSFTLHRYNIR